MVGRGCPATRPIVEYCVALPQFGCKAENIVSSSEPMFCGSCSKLAIVKCSGKIG